MAQKVKDLALSLLWLWLPQELPYAAGTAKKKRKKKISRELSVDSKAAYLMALYIYI